MLGKLTQPIDTLDCILSMSQKCDYKKQYSFEQRSIDSLLVMTKYPDRIPVIIEKYYSSKLVDIDRKKYLVPRDMTVGQLMYTIRKRIKLTPDKAIFIFVNNINPHSSLLIYELYDKYKDNDGFLYIIYQEESVFG